MDVRFFTTIVLLFFLLPSQAEVYKCIVNGKTIFSDQPCAKDAEKIELKLYKPKTEDIQRQQQSTQSFSENSRVNEILTLRKMNVVLENKKIQLKKEMEAQLKILEKKTYSVPNGRASTERGVFQKMADVTNQYQRDVQATNVEINKNERKISELTSKAPQ